MANRLENRECLTCGQKLIRIDGVPYCTIHEAEQARLIKSILAKRERIKRGQEKGKMPGYRIMNPKARGH